jgi:hypothetical protein
MGEPRTHASRMWSPPDRPWQYDVLDRLPPGIDESQIEYFLSLTPSERIDELQRLVDFAVPLIGKVHGDAVR